MRKSLFAALTLLAAPTLAADAPAGVAPPGSGDLPTEEPARAAPAECRDRIATVRAERGLPLLDRRNAKPDDADVLLFYAVDRNIDGCDVLVMAGDPRDIRPLPQFDERDWRVRPAQ